MLGVVTLNKKMNAATRDLIGFSISGAQIRGTIDILTKA
jgi:hypothetical protein